MPRIKDPLLIDQTFGSYQKVYEVDVEGKKIIATFTYDGEEEHRSGWEYDLSPCYVDLTEGEIRELEAEFYEMLCESTTAGNLNEENDMTKEDFKDLDNALALLHDYISNYGAKEEHYKILNSAEDVLRGYVSTGGEVC